MEVIEVATEAVEVVEEEDLVEVDKVKAMEMPKGCNRNQTWGKDLRPLADLVSADMQTSRSIQQDAPRKHALSSTHQGLT